MSDMYSRGERCLRKSHQLSRQMWDYYQSLPLRSTKKRTPSEEIHQKQSNKKSLGRNSSEGSKSQSSVEHNLYQPIDTIINPNEEQPPILREYDTDLRFEERMIDPFIDPYIKRPDPQPSHRESPKLETSETKPSTQIRDSSIEMSGKKCFRYLNACKQLTERMEKEGLDSTNMKTVLKYALIKSFLGDIDLTIDAIKSASKDMIIGTSYDIESRSEVRSDANGSADSQTRDNKPNWSGRLYTPQPKYD